MNRLRLLLLLAALLALGTLTSGARTPAPFLAPLAPLPPVLPADTLRAPATRVDSLLRDAFGCLGVRYRYGASGERGFDCSGFTSYIFRKYGYELGRSSRAQARDGIAVGRDSLLPGDIVVFSGRRISKNVAGHVGIVVSVDRSTGDFSFIHASCSRGVTVSRLGAERYYAQRYIDARRILPPEAHLDLTPLSAAGRLAPQLVLPPHPVLRPAPLLKPEVSVRHKRHRGWSRLF